MLARRFREKQKNNRWITSVSKAMFNLPSLPTELLEPWESAPDAVRQFFFGVLPEAPELLEKCLKQWEQTIDSGHFSVVNDFFQEMIKHSSNWERITTRTLRSLQMLCRFGGQAWSFGCSSTRILNRDVSEICLILAQRGCISIFHPPRRRVEDQTWRHSQLNDNSLLKLVCSFIGSNVELKELAPASDSIQETPIKRKRTKRKIPMVGHSGGDTAKHKSRRIIVMPVHALFE